MKIKINIKECPVPIIWLDTSIIFRMTQWKHKIGTLEPRMLDHINRLYDQIYDATRSGKLICPLAEQEAEVWIERKKWFKTMHSLTLGIETADRQTIHDNQFRACLNAFFHKRNEINLNYNDAFLDDPVIELREILKNPIFVYVQSDILFGEDYVKKSKKKLLNSLNEQRRRNLKAKISFEEQLEAEYMGEIDALRILKNQFLTNAFNDENEQMNAVAGAITLNQQLMMWENCSGNSNDISGLIEFYKSQYYRSMPFTNISCNLLAKLMTDQQDIKIGDNMDINHVATLMPYSDLFITDKAMSTFLKRNKYDKIYNTRICYLWDTQEIDSFFAQL